MIVYELRQSQFTTVASLLQDAWIDRALIESIIEGIRPARVFVDNLDEPRAALTCGMELGEYLIAGNSTPGPIRQFIKDMPSEAEVFNRQSFAYFMHEIVWEKALMEDRAGAIVIFPTRSFWYKKPFIKPISDWRSDLNRSDEVRAIDTAFVQDVRNGKLKCGSEFNLGELEHINANRFGFCTVVQDEIVCVAYALNLSSKFASVSVDTAEPFRRRGLAMLTCAAFIEHCLKKGITPIWNCLQSNTASGALAIKLGFDEGPPQRESGWAPLQWQYKTTAGLWTKQAHADAYAIWERQTSNP